jgi:hypothetical protein
MYPDSTIVIAEGFCRQRLRFSLMLKSCRRPCRRHNLWLSFGILFLQH